MTYTQVPEVVLEALHNSGLEASDLDWLLLHQANIRIMEHTADMLGISMDKVLRNIAEYGNTSAGWYLFCIYFALFTMNRFGLF